MSDYAPGAHRLTGLTAEQFEREYAERDELPLEELRKWKTVRLCDCDWEGCQGWQSVSHGAALEIDDPAKPWAR